MAGGYCKIQGTLDLLDDSTSPKITSLHRIHESTADAEASSFIKFFHMGVKVGSNHEEEAQSDIPAGIVLSMSFFGDSTLLADKNHPS